MPEERIWRGVIADARVRQRRQRRSAAAVIGLAIGVAILLLAVGEPSGGSHSAPGLTIGSRPTPIGARAAPRSAGTLVDCTTPPLARPKALQGAPSEVLLATFGVLRRPATGSDALPSRVEQRMLAYPSFKEGIFVNYVRRAAVIDGTTVWVYPERFRPPCKGGAPSDIIASYAVPGIGGDAGTVAEIRDAENPATLSGFWHSTVAMLIPDGVATVVLHYPPGRIGGSNSHHAAAATITTNVVGNVIVATVPRAGYRLFAPMTMTWLAANGSVVKTFNRLR